MKYKSKNSLIIQRCAKQKSSFRPTYIKPVFSSKFPEYKYYNNSCTEQSYINREGFEIQAQYNITRVLK